MIGLGIKKRLKVKFANQACFKVLVNDLTTLARC